MSYLVYKNISVEQGEKVDDHVVQIETVKKVRIFSINDVYVFERLPSLKQFILDHSHEEGDVSYVTTLAGDFLAPSLMSTIDNGKSMVDLLNNIPMDYVCFGNHEFNLAYDELRKRMGEINSTWMNSNVVMNEYKGDNMKSFTITEFDGYTVGMFAVTTQDVFFQPTFNGRVIIEDPIEWGKKMVHFLKHQHNVDFVIGMTHLDISEDRQLARECAGDLDLIIGGHNHDEYREDIEIDGRKTLIVKCGHDAKYVGVTDITLSNPGNVEKSIQYELVDIRKYPANEDLRMKVQECNNVLESSKQ